jgi:hypothetical protein
MATEAETPPPHPTRALQNLRLSSNVTDLVYLCTIFQVTPTFRVTQCLEQYSIMQSLPNHPRTSHNPKSWSTRLERTKQEWWIRQKSSWQSAPAAMAKALYYARIAEGLVGNAMPSWSSLENAIAVCRAVRDMLAVQGVTEEGWQSASAAILTNGK